MTAESVVPEGAEQDIKTTETDLGELREQLEAGSETVSKPTRRRACTT